MWKALPVTGLQDTSAQTLPICMGQGERASCNEASVSLGGSAETAQAFQPAVWPYSCPLALLSHVAGGCGSPL